MVKTTSFSINLAKNRGESLVDRVIGFALTIGRVLIIGTELVALAAFLYRFSLDQSLVGLHDTIQQQEAVVNLLHNNEVLFRSIQDRLHAASLLVNKSNQLPTYLIDIENFTPPDMTIQSIAVATEGIHIQATAQSVDSLSQFVDKLKAYKDVQSVSIDRIDNQTQYGTITVSITVLLKQSNIAGPAQPAAAQQNL